MTASNSLHNASRNFTPACEKLAAILHGARKEFKKITIHPVSGMKNWKDHKKEVKNIVSLFKQSGLKLDKFCAATNITNSTLYYYVSYIVLDQMLDKDEINDKKLRPVKIENKISAQQFLKNELQYLVDLKDIKLSKDRKFIWVAIPIPS